MQSNNNLTDFNIRSILVCYVCPDFQPCWTSRGAVGEKMRHENTPRPAVINPAHGGPALQIL